MEEVLQLKLDQLVFDLHKLKEYAPVMKTAADYKDEEKRKRDIRELLATANGLLGGKDKATKIFKKSPYLLALQRTSKALEEVHRIGTDKPTLTEVEEFLFL
jgi:hypothetical protein